LPFWTVVSLPPESVSVVQEPGNGSQAPETSGASPRSTIPLLASKPDSPAPSDPFASVTATEVEVT